MVVSFSTTAQVRTTVNDSPTLTAPALVRHQQRMGSASTVSVGGAPDEFCGLWVVACAPRETPTASTNPRLIHPLFLSTKTHTFSHTLFFPHNHSPSTAPS